MTTRMYIEEIKRFLKENFKLITLLSVIGTGLFFVFLNLTLGSNSNEEQPSVIGEQINDVSTKYAQFMVYIEKSDASPFVNNALLERLMLDSENIGNVEELVGIEILPLLELQIEQEFSATPIDRGVIGFERDPVTDSLKFVSKIGTEEERLQTSQYFFNLIENNEIDFLTDKQVTIIEEPHLHEYTPDELRKAEQSLAVLVSDDSSQIMLIIEILLSIIVGLLFGIILMVLYHIYTSKINYAFNYQVNENDLFIIARDNTQEFIYAIEEPNTGEKLLVSESKLPNDISNQIEAVVLETQNVLEVSPEKRFLEIVIVVLEGKTDKEWYSKQINYSRRLSSSVKVVQTNSDILHAVNEPH